MGIVNKKIKKKYNFNIMNAESRMSHNPLGVELNVGKKTNLFASSSENHESNCVFGVSNYKDWHSYHDYLYNLTVA